MKNSLVITNVTTCCSNRDREVRWEADSSAADPVGDKVRELGAQGFFDRKRPVGPKGLRVATVRSIGTDLSSVVMSIVVTKKQDGTFKCRARLNGLALRQFFADGGTLS